MSVLLGIDIGGTAVKAGLVDETGAILLSETRSVDFDGYRTPILTTVAALARELLEKSPEKPAGIGVSATGQIDVRSGTVIGVGASLGNWLGSEIARTLGDAFGLPVTVINDANATAGRARAATAAALSATVRPARSCGGSPAIRSCWRRSACPRRTLTAR